jgi:hypothetical protein
MDGEVGLLVTFQIQGPNLHRAMDWILVDASPGDVTVENDWSWTSDLNRKYLHGVIAQSTVLQRCNGSRKRR